MINFLEYQEIIESKKVYNMVRNYIGLDKPETLPWHYAMKKLQKSQLVRLEGLLFALKHGYDWPRRYAYKKF